MLKVKTRAYAVGIQINSPLTQVHIYHSSALVQDSWWPQPCFRVYLLTMSQSKRRSAQCSVSYRVDYDSIYLNKVFLFCFHPQTHTALSWSSQIVLSVAYILACTLDSHFLRAKKAILYVFYMYLSNCLKAYSCKNQPSLKNTEGASVWYSWPMRLVVSHVCHASGHKERAA